MIIHYDRTPYLPRGRHASRIQRTMHRRRRSWVYLKDHVRNWEQRTGQRVNDEPDVPRRSDWYDIDGNPITMLEAMALTDNIAKRRIGETYIGDYRVSTVHMPDVVHFTDDGRPLIFETMVFGKTGSPAQKWLTWSKERAALMHEQVCDMVRNGEAP